MEKWWKECWKTVKQRSCCCPRHETEQLPVKKDTSVGYLPCRSKMCSQVGNGVTSKVQEAQCKWDESVLGAVGCDFLCQPWWIGPLDFYCRNLSWKWMERVLCPSSSISKFFCIWTNRVNSSCGIMSISQTRAFKTTIAEQLQQLNLELWMQASGLWFSKNLHTIKKQPILRAPNVPSKCSSCRMLVAHE